MSTLNDITELASKQFGRDVADIDVDAPFDKLGADSLGMLEFLFELEDHFSVAIPQEDAVKATSIRSLAALIDQLRAAAPPQTSTAG
jgi:acyl carrier protein